MSQRVTLASAQVVVAREHGFSSWTALKAAVDGSQRDGVTALMAGKHARRAVSSAADFHAWARSQGWEPGDVPCGAVFTSAAFITAHLEGSPERYRPADAIRPTNGRVFMTVDEPLVAVTCLGVGAPAVVTQVEHLVELGVGAFVAAGPAPAICEDLRPGDCVVVDSALRDDGVSQHYLEPGRYVRGDGRLTTAVFLEAERRGLRPRRGSTWTVPTPYRTTAEEIRAYRAEGVLTTELSTAALFAVAVALKVRAASIVVVSRNLGAVKQASTAGGHGGEVLLALDAAIGAARTEALRAASERGRP